MTITDDFDGRFSHSDGSDLRDPLLRKPSSSSSSSLVGQIGSVLVAIQLLFFSIVSATILNGKCGFPGKPYMSKVDLDLKLHYYEGEEVQYQCMDYWNYIQVRQCRKGHWTGPPARCANFLKYVWLRDVQIEDITNPLQPHDIINVRNITLDTGSWKFPNAFTNTRSQQKFILHDNRLYRWRLQFNDTFDKLFVRFNFNTINYTRLAIEQKAHYYLNVSLDVGPERQCVLEMQTFDIWKVNGQKIDNFFVCDTKSFDSTLFNSEYALDKRGPTNGMTLYTKSSLNVSYELIAVFLGKAYGTPKEPICGEPEHDISHFARFNQQFRDYSYECKKGDWLYQQFEDNSTKLSDTGIHFKRCVTDMKWFGSYPTCLPKKQCPIDQLLIDSPGNGPDQSMSIVTLDGLYFVNDTLYYAIDGTVATYGCTNATTHILVGKETRTCFRNGTWSGNKPTCHDPNKAKISLLLIVIVGSSLMILFIIVVLFVVITKRFKQKIMKSIESQQQQTIAVKELMDLYSYDTDRHSSDIYENYHEIDDRYSKSAAEEVNQYVAIDYSGPDSIRRHLNSPEYVEPALIGKHSSHGLIPIQDKKKSKLLQQHLEQQQSFDTSATEEDQEELQYLTMQAERTNQVVSLVIPNPAPRLAGNRAKSLAIANSTGNAENGHQDNPNAIYINYSS